MCYLSKISAVVYICIVICLVLSVGIPFKEPCTRVPQNCTNKESIVWTVLDRKCFVWRNECLWDNENCRRHNLYKKDYIAVTKRQCQKLCPTTCPNDYDPICAQYNNHTTVFDNDCEMNGHICWSGEPYVIFGGGICDSD